MSLPSASTRSLVQAGRVAARQSPGTLEVAVDQTPEMLAAEDAYSSKAGDNRVVTLAGAPAQLAEREKLTKRLLAVPKGGVDNEREKAERKRPK